MRVRHPLHRPRLWAWPCVLPGTGQEFLYELKQMMNCKTQRKNPSADFSQALPWVSGTWPCPSRLHLQERTTRRAGLSTRAHFQQIPCPYLGLFMAPLGGLWPSISFPRRVDFVLKTSFSYRSVIVSWSQFYKPHFSKCSTSRLLFLTYNGDKSNNYGVH